MQTICWIILATLINGAVALAGAFSFLISKKNLKKITVLLVAFAIGALLGGALFHFLPEAAEELNLIKTIILTLIGIIIFFVLEKILHWHHCHNRECRVHPFTYLSIYGDGLHNFFDGLIIAGSFLISIPLGVLTSLLIIAHEFPQEIADFGVLVYGGLSRARALFYNFLAQLTAVLGGILGYLFLQANEFAVYLMPVAAGGFLYIAICDLIPEVWKEKNIKKRIANILFIALGLVVLIIAKILVG